MGTSTCQGTRPRAASGGGLWQVHFNKDVKQIAQQLKTLLIPFTNSANPSEGCTDPGVCAACYKSPTPHLNPICEGEKQHT